MSGEARRIRTGAIELQAERFGDHGPPLLLIMGLGAQMLLWPDGLCEQLADAGYQVIRFDNRDVGASSRLEHLGVPSLARDVLRSRVGLPVRSPYTLTDMAHDALAVLDAYSLPSATVVGASMGGMIAQRLAALAPERVDALVSVMSSVDARFTPHPATLAKLMRRPEPGRDGFIDHMVTLFRAMGSQSLPSPEDELRELAARCFDRGPSPTGFMRQFSAILADGDRSELVQQLTMPRLVIHGDEDRLVPLRAGRKAARALRAPLQVIPGMGHDLPPARWPQYVDAIASLTRDAAARRSA